MVFKRLVNKGTITYFVSILFFFLPLVDFLWGVGGGGKGVGKGLFNCNIWQVLGVCSEVICWTVSGDFSWESQSPPIESSLPPWVKKSLVALFVTGVLACPPFSLTTNVAACIQAIGHKENKDCGNLSIGSWCDIPLLAHLLLPNVYSPAPTHTRGKGQITRPLRVWGVA